MPTTIRPRYQYYLLLVTAASFLSAAGCDDDGGPKAVDPPKGPDTAVVAPSGYQQYGTPFADVPATEMPSAGWCANCATSRASGSGARSAIRRLASTSLPSRMRPAGSCRAASWLGSAYIIPLPRR